MKIWFHSKGAQRDRTVTLRIDCGTAAAIDRFVKAGIERYKKVANNTRIDLEDRIFAEAEVAEMEAFLSALNRHTKP